MFPTSYNPPATDRLLSVILTINQYPVLGARIRHMMRKRIYLKGVITQETFEAEVRQNAVQSQTREGLRDPLSEEVPDIWEKRICAMRDQLTDFYFSMYFPFEELDAIIHDTL